MWRQDTRRPPVQTQSAEERSLPQPRRLEHGAADTRGARPHRGCESKALGSLAAGTRQARGDIGSAIPELISEQVRADDA